MSKNYVAHKFRLKPTKEQATVLKSWCDINRYVWNHFLAANQNKYQAEKKFIFYHEMANLLPALKKEHEFLKSPPSQSLQGICQRLESAIKRVWQTGNGFPHFKSRKRGDLPSIQIPQGSNQIKWTKNHIQLPKIGNIKWAKHRPLGGKLISTTTKYEGGHCCGSIKPMPLHIRTYECDSCGMSLDRDLNAAINLRNITFGTKENYACGDSTIGIDDRSSVRYESLKQEKFEVLAFGQV